MKKAVEEVDKCRMTLKWTYAMAYYLAKGNEKDLFEDNQRWVAAVMSSRVLSPILLITAYILYRDLERAVEDLSELLESPIEPENIPTLRQKVTDKTVCYSPSFHLPPFVDQIQIQVYVQKRNEIVLEDTANGLLEGRWKWNVVVEGFDDPEKVDC